MSDDLVILRAEVQRLQACVTREQDCAAAAIHDYEVANLKLLDQLQRATDALDAAGWRHCPDCGSWWKVGSPAPDQTWRPIETADKTRPVLLHAKNQGRVVGYWHAAAENSAWETLPGWHRVEPTHWQPLPAQPGDGENATIEVHARTCPRAQTDQQAVKVRLEPNPDVIQESLQSGIGFVKPTKTWMCRACNGVSVISADDIQHYANCARPR